MTNQEKILHAFSNELVCNIVYHNKVSKSGRKDQRRKVECRVTGFDSTKDFFRITTTDGKYKTYRYEGVHTITFK